MGRKSTNAAAAAEQPTPAKFSASAIAKKLAAEVREHGIRGTARRARLSSSALARKANNPKLMTVRDIDSLTKLFGW